MNDLLAFLIGRLSSLLAWLSGLQIVEGVNLLTFFGAMFIITLLISNFLFSAK